MTLFPSSEDENRGQMSAEAGAGRGGKPDTLLPAVGPLGELRLSRWGDGSASPPPRPAPAGFVYSISQVCIIPGAQEARGWAG